MTPARLGIHFRSTGYPPLSPYVYGTGEILFAEYSTFGQALYVEILEFVWVHADFQVALFRLVYEKVTEILLVYFKVWMWLKVEFNTRELEFERYPGHCGRVVADLGYARVYKTAILLIDVLDSLHRICFSSRGLAIREYRRVKSCQ
jgi:hypothetical protein